ncbi:hypothetical protein HU200_004982 [Digitaria exilis]|uniref:Uncharacterized protein n=1 Tax=Digitaria exilis TaxID=1010633 RepID=A0A835KWS0_9POAL|nr:hypothetical protein HU200_004982 [Digitaria exilis]
MFRRAGAVVQRRRAGQQRAGAVVQLRRRSSGCGATATTATARQCRLAILSFRPYPPTAARGRSRPPRCSPSIRREPSRRKKTTATLSFLTQSRTYSARPHRLSATGALPSAWSTITIRHALHPGPWRPATAAMLYNVGLGFGNMRNITLHAVHSCSKIDMELYTFHLSIGLDVDSAAPANLEKLYGKEITVADQDMVEERIDQVLLQAAGI